MKANSKRLEAKTAFVFKRNGDRVVAMSDPTTATLSNMPTCPTVPPTTGSGIK